MLYVEWLSGYIRGRIHLASNRMKTLCGKPIPRDAKEAARPPRDKTRICKQCGKVEEDERPYRHLFK